MQKWEYFEQTWRPANGKYRWAKLREKGEEGWELVSTTSILPDPNRDEELILYTFKRPLG